MKMNEINIIIPALEKNKYSEYGDLVSFGETTLLEWKISQAKKVDGIKNIYVTSSSNLIKNLCKKNNVKFLQRKPKIALDKLHRILPCLLVVPVLCIYYLLPYLYVYAAL